jgi:quinol-cytochrome oxidoreductase complex cytochrome b subunit
MTEMEKEEKTIPFYPDHVSTEFRVAVGILIGAVIIGVIGLLSPIGLGAQADPMDTPEHTKPEWYFLFLYEVLKYVPKTLGSILPFVLIAILILWPFFDRRGDSRRARTVRIIVTTVSMIAIVILTFMGHFS